MKSYQTYPVQNEHQGLTVEEYLKRVLQYSGRKLQKLTRHKGILLNKKTVFLQKKVKTGDILSVLIQEDLSYGVLPEEGIVDILYEDAHIIVLNKPAKMLVHPAGQTTHGTLANYLAYYFHQKREIFTIRPLHRLDRDTSGCVVFAKDSQTQSLLEQQLQQGSLKRLYYALVEGHVEPQEETIDLPLGVHPKMPNRRIVSQEGERAVTHYRTISMDKITSMDKISLLELNLETGRTHQIRVHLAYIGHPVLGDTMYGRRSPLISRQALHAHTIMFTHPHTGAPITVSAPVSEDFKNIIG